MCIQRLTERDSMGRRTPSGERRPAPMTWRGQPARVARAGFTLLELMVVMALIVVLAGMAMASYRNAVTLGQEAVLKEDLFRMKDAIDQYYADKNKYPANLQALVSDGYLRAIPEDPFTRSSSTWQEVPAEPDANNVSAEIGVYDVKSGSDRISSQGVPYNEW